VTSTFLEESRALAGQVTSRMPQVTSTKIHRYPLLPTNQTSIPYLALRFSPGSQSDTITSCLIWGGRQEPCCVPIMEQRRSTSRSSESAEDEQPRNLSRSGRRAPARADGARLASGSGALTKREANREAAAGAAEGPPLDSTTRRDGEPLGEHRGNLGRAHAEHVGDPFWQQRRSAR